MKTNHFGETPSFVLEQLEPRQLLSTYYALPWNDVKEAFRDGTNDYPYCMQEIWDINDGEGPEPGDTILLRNNGAPGSVEVYDSPEDMIAPPWWVDGEYDEETEERTPITIQAETDGGVLIDGGANYAPVKLDHNDYFDIIGINATLTPNQNLDRNAVLVASSNNVNLRRICAWNADDGPGASHNNMVFQIATDEDVLLEDCAGWGTGRKIFQFYDSSYITLRRCFGRWEQYESDYGPREVYSLSYNTNHILFENCIGTWDSWQMEPEDSSDRCHALGVFGGDTGFAVEGIAAPRLWRKAA